MNSKYKIQGNIIELEEIETEILSFDNITACIVCFDDKAEELVAFYSSADGKIDESFSAKLKKVLPEYMVPNKFILVKNFIYSITGKVDRKAMLNRYLDNISINNSANNNGENSIKESINLLVLKCLHINDSTIDWDLPIDQLGFNSITYVEFILELEELLNIDLDEKVLFIDNGLNLNQICEYVSSLIEEEGDL